MRIVQSSAGEVNKTFLLAVTMASHFFNPFMGSAVNVALKRIGTEFSMSAVGLSWVTMAYLLSVAIFLVPFGRLGDTWGRTRLFFYGNLFFTLTTLLCGLAGSSTMLITMRFLQGIATAMMTSTTMALVISAFPPESRGKVIGLNISAVYVGSSLAPMLGGILTDSLGWRSIFMINAATGAIITALIVWKLRKEWFQPVRAKFDYAGSLVYMIAISMLMYGFSRLPEPHAIALTVAGLLGMIGFVRMEGRMASPVLNIRLFTENRVFALSNLSALINYAATFALSFMLSLYLQYVRGMEAREAGLVLMAQPIMMAVVASFSGRLSDRRNPRILAAAGMGLSAIGLFLLSFLSDDTSVIYILTGMVILGTGFGLFSSPNMNVVMSAVDKSVYGTASSILATMRNTGMMFSMAIASMTIHILLGDAEIAAHNLNAFNSSTRIVFSVFTILCLLGIYTSGAKSRKSA